MAPAEVIDISSDSESEKAPTHALEAILEDFGPWKVKATTKAVSLTRGASPSTSQAAIASRANGYATPGASRGAPHQSPHRTGTGLQSAKELVVNGHSTPQLRSPHNPVLPSGGKSDYRLPTGIYLAPEYRHDRGTAQAAIEAERSQRVQNHDSFRAIESVRSGGLVNAGQRPWLSLDRLNSDQRKKHEDRLDGSPAQHAPTNGTQARPVLAGAGIAIIDSREEPNSQLQCIDRTPKRHATAPETAYPAMPPAKRLRTEGDSLAAVPQLRPPSTLAEHETAQRAEHTASSARQLQEALESAASGSPQRPSTVSHAHAQLIRTQSVTEAANDVNLAPHQAPARSGHNVPYTQEENALLARLKEVDRLSWAEIMLYFPGRSKGSIGVHYSTKVKGRFRGVAQQMSAPKRPPPQTAIPEVHPITKELVSAGEPQYEAPARRKRGGGPSALDGFVSWSQVPKQVFGDSDAAIETAQPDAAAEETGPLAKQDRAYPRSMAQILRQREFGNKGSRAWTSPAKGVTDELRNHAYSGYALRMSYGPTCGDVTCLSWAPDGQRFAAGSIAITDDRSMQYNSGRNLLLGDCIDGTLQELPEHHVPRPLIADGENLNASHSMRESQDPRLFMTVAATAFSPDGQSLYSAGSDTFLRRYAVRGNVTKAEHRYAIPHVARVDLFDVSRQGLLATGCHSSADGSVQVFGCSRRSYQSKLVLSPNRTDSASPLPIFPSALKWGVAPQHKHFLLAGFSSDSSDDDRDTTGETALWNIETGKRVPLSTVTRNVFDIAWNPTLSPASTSFCIASTPGNGKSSVERRSVVQCYAPGQDRARQVIEFDCPAFDINDVTYCPHDNNLIAAGATDGKVYIWDHRYARQSQKPLHVLSHGDSINILDHDRERELADTGVRFLSWGATASRLYAGSSDGVVKAWNPYRSTNSAHVEDVGTFQAAIMSGSFSPDCCQLLVGEESGRLNLLALGHDTEERAAQPSKAFRLDAVETPYDQESPHAAARELLKSRQIEIRPMGTLPIRQAVQGSAYKGPYLEPSPADWAHAQASYQQALDAQNESHSRKASLDGGEPVSEEETRKADARVEQAREGLVRLQSRHDAFLELEPSATRTQRAFKKAQKRRMSHEDPADHCKLDCNYLAPQLDGEDGVPDSHRSDQRISGALRTLPRHHVDVSELSCSELFEHGLAGQCGSCSSKQGNARMAQHLGLLCRQRCNNIRAGSTGVCKFCSAPVRSEKGAALAGKPLCERCRFACFRCAQPVQLLTGASADEQTIYCSDCDLAWELGVLGYDLVRDRAKKGQPKKQAAATRLDGDDTELHFYHSRWQAAANM